MRKLSFLLGLYLLMSSCEKKSDNLTVLLNQSGTVSIAVVDNDNNRVQGAAVKVVTLIPDRGGEIYSDSTNKEGLCDVGKVLEGGYACYVSVKRENRFYSETKYFQAIAGDNKTVEVNPFFNIGNAKVKVVDYRSEPITNVNVALIPHYHNYYSFDYNDLIKEAYGIEKTDSDGWVKFKDMPTTADYSVLVYFDRENYDYTNAYIKILRDTEQRYTVQVSF